MISTLMITVFVTTVFVKLEGRSTCNSWGKGEEVASRLGSTGVTLTSTFLNNLQIGMAFSSARGVSRTVVQRPKTSMRM